MVRTMPRLRLWRCAVVVLTTGCGLAACQTTGDPRQGGLFGWSEQQARERQADLARDEAQAKLQAEAEQARSGQLRDRQSGLKSESTRLQADIDRLLSENTHLERELRTLMSKRRVGGHELARLQQLLAANEHTRAAVRPTAAGVGTQPPAVLAAHSESVNAQNQRLQREVTLLLQR